MTLDARETQDGPLDPRTFVAGGSMPGLRSWLRARPRLQGFALAPAGARYRLPHTLGALYFPFYHGATEDQVQGLRHHLQAMQQRGRFVTWDEALAALEQTDPLPGPLFCLSFDDGHKEWPDRVVPLLQELNIPATFFLTTNKVVTGESHDELTWSDCKRLLDAGMQIGSHSVTHARLALLDDAAARREVWESKQEIESRLGIPVPDFAVPYGLPEIDYTQRDLAMIAEAGYRSCTSALPGRMSPGDSPFAVLRSGLSPSWPLIAVRKRLHE
ncbi:MAG: polysaccharide deacetylase family protein [Mycobacteriales bacterium]